MDVSFDELYALTLLLEGQETRRRWPLFERIINSLEPVDFVLTAQPDGSYLAAKGDTVYVLDPNLPDGIAELEDVVAAV